MLENRPNDALGKLVNLVKLANLVKVANLVKLVKTRKFCNKLVKLVKL